MSEGGHTCQQEGFIEQEAIVARESGDGGDDAFAGKEGGRVDLGWLEYACNRRPRSCNMYQQAATQSMVYSAGERGWVGGG